MAGQSADLMAYLLDEAFAGEGDVVDGDSHSLLANLRGVGDVLARQLPPGGVRSIRDILYHVGTAKYQYDDHIFGAGTASWEDAAPAGWPAPDAPLDELVAWLRRTHTSFVGHLRAAGDAVLVPEHTTVWLRPFQTRWLLMRMQEHDLYHAGEINHIRSLLAGDDRWAYEQSR